MPELPEVETIKSQLQPVLPFRIDEVNYSNRTTRLIKTRDFDLKGKVITKIYRRGKWLLFDLENGGHLISHLGMSGSWQISNQTKNDKHGHIELIDCNNKIFSHLTYVDPRRFGHFYIADEQTFQNKIATIPFDVSDKSFDENIIAENFFKHPQKILKPYLLDQQAFPGVGNYMASEICAKAGLLPTRIVGELNSIDIMNIKNAIQDVVEGAIKTKGTTFSGGYKDANGEKGKGVQNLVVFYQEYCQLCSNNKKQTEVIKITLAGRGTYFCPVCQH